MRLRNMALPSFWEYIKDKDLIFFGAGKLLRRFCLCTHFELNIKAVFDNDKQKQGKELSCGSHFFKVYPWTELDKVSFVAGKTIVVISVGMGKGGRQLYEELAKRDFPAEVECFFLSFIFAEVESVERVGYPMEFKLSSEAMIPRYIHYCWFGENKIPEEQQRFIQGWHEKCPNFEIIRWDESNYDIKKNSYMRRAYEEKRWGFVPDYARKDIVYKYGGIYLDTDVEVIQDLEGLLYQRGFAGRQLDNRVNFGLGFGGVPGLDIMAEMCEVYEREEFSFSDGMLMKIGPDYETEILNNHGYNADEEIQTVAGLTIYPGEVLSGTLAFSNKPFITENTFSIHHYAGSWTTGKRKATNREAADFYHKVKISETGS